MRSIMLYQRDLNLHSALGNVSGKWKSDSGSEQIHALKTFLQTGDDILK
jgi:hypothetical protein